MQYFYWSADMLCLTKYYYKWYTINLFFDALMYVYPVTFILMSNDPYGNIFDLYLF